jgi:hypothetical protein
MFVVNEDNSIYVTRGDAGTISVSAKVDGANYVFRAGDVVRFKVTQKKACENVVLQKDFPITVDTEIVDIYLSEKDTKIGDVISKPVDYWYEVELNPFTNPQTIIGYDDDGAKIFKLHPEGRDLVDEPTTEEDVPVVDTDLSLTSSKPVENKVIARAVTNLNSNIATLEGKIAEEKKTRETQGATLQATINRNTSEISNNVNVLEARMNTFTALPEGTTTADAEIIDARIGADGTIYSNLGENIRKNTKSIYKPFEYDITPVMPPDYADNIVVSKSNGLYHIETSYTYGQAYWGVSIPLNKTQQELANKIIYVKIHNSEKLQNVDCIISNRWNAWAGSGVVTQWNAVKDNECEIVLPKEKDFGTGDLFFMVGSFSPQQTVSFDFSVYEIPEEKAPNITPYAIESGHSLTADNLKDFNKDDYMIFGNYITCWGDSLTHNGQWIDKLSELSGYDGYNGGCGGESCSTIVARQGADVMLVNNVTIPADTTPVTLTTYANGFNTYLGKKATPLLQGMQQNVNPVTINDIKGTLTWTGSSHRDSTGVWTFTRLEAGDEVVIDRPTPMLTVYDRERNNPHLMVIFMGQNGGYTDNADLINQHKLMIEHSHAKNVIVLGLSSGTATDRVEYETEMRKAFGRYFISLREYLSKYGLEDAGLTPTEADITAMNEGRVPPQLLIDAVHYTNACKTVIGNMLYKKCKELNIF